MKREQDLARLIALPECFDKGFAFAVARKTRIHWASNDETIILQHKGRDKMILHSGRMNPSGAELPKNPRPS